MVDEFLNCFHHARRDWHHFCLDSRARPRSHPPLCRLPVTLGRTGTLPASLIDTLKNKLKVSPKAANECCATKLTKLTQHAVHYVEKFYKNRFASLAKHAAPSAAPPRQTVDG